MLVFWWDWYLCWGRQEGGWWRGGGECECERVRWEKGWERARGDALGGFVVRGHGR